VLDLMLGAINNHAEGPWATFAIEKTFTKGEVAGDYLLPLFLALVLAAFLAAFERSDAVRRLAADFVCCESALWETVLVGSFFNAFVLDLDLFCDTGLFDFALSSSCCAFFFKAAPPLLGVGSSTPARRASDRPIAIACLAERTPCFPSLTFSISSCTNSPACVLADLPSALSFFAFSIVVLSGIKNFYVLLSN